MSIFNRIKNAKNKNQGNYKKVLCLCSAGQLRSATAALILSQEPFNYNTRAAGTHSEYALILIDPVLVAWADEFVCATREQVEALKFMLHKDDSRNIINLEISDDYEYRDPELIKLITERYARALVAIEKPN